MAKMFASRVARMKVPLPTFTTARYNARYNMCHEDRLKLYNWNLFTLGVTAFPLGYLYCKNWQTSYDTQMIYNTMDPIGEAVIGRDLNLFK